MKKKSVKKQPLTLHGLLGALSFWGTATRTLLFGFLAVAVFLAALSETTTAAAVDNEVMVFIYVISSFLLLDFGYVLVAKTYALAKRRDMLVLALADAVLAMLYIVPKLLVDSGITLRTDPLIFIMFVPIIVLGLRMLVGILYGKHAR
ncbi:TPA: hypothetical protein DCF80_02860 [Candidatus Saccharibacteria bacterium]|nr:hypothetical protein [Candidatus Saccharibacteria bacterium]HRK41158.1 hypothetical protein [Candidatus Saccharibacteria bacterium]